MTATEKKLIVANMALRKIGAKPITSLDITVDTSEEAKAVDAVYDIVRDEVLGTHPWSFAQKRKTLDYLVPSDSSLTLDTPITITDITEANPAVITAAGHGLSDADLIKISSVLGMADVNNNFYLVASKATDTLEITTLAGVLIDSSAYTAYSSGGQIEKAIDMEMTEDGLRVVYERPSDFISLNFTNSSSAIVRLEQDGILSDTDNLKIIYTYRNDDPNKYRSDFITALITRLAYELCFQITEARNYAADLLEDYENVRLPNAKSQDSKQGTPVGITQDEWENSRLSGAGGYQTHGSGVWHPY
jgi:hypothetical protein